MTDIEKSLWDMNTNLTQMLAALTTSLKTDKVDRDKDSDALVNRFVSNETSMRENNATNKKSNEAVIKRLDVMDANRIANNANRDKAAQEAAENYKAAVRADTIAFELCVTGIKQGITDQLQKA